MSVSKTTAQPWERQEGETVKAFEAFCVYRDLGKSRSQEKAAEKLSKSRQQMCKWSMKYNWVERVEAWEEEQDRLIRVELTKDIGAMRKKHADIANALLIKAATALKKIPDSEIKASDISKMIETATKLERISKGDVGDVIEERKGIDALDPVQIYIPDNKRGRGNESFDDLEV